MLRSPFLSIYYLFYVRAIEIISATWAIPYCLLGSNEAIDMDYSLNSVETIERKPSNWNWFKLLKRKIIIVINSNSTYDAAGLIETDFNKQHRPKQLSFNQPILKTVNLISNQQYHSLFSWLLSFQ